MLHHILTNLEDNDVDYMILDLNMKIMTENVSLQTIRHNQKVNTLKDLSVLTLPAHEMENVRDQKARTLRRNMTGTMIQPWTT